MITHATPIYHPPGSWLSGLVLWGIAYAQEPTSPASYEAAGLPIAGRSCLGRLLLSDSDSAVALRQLAAGYAGAMLASAAQPAGLDRAPSSRLAATHTRPDTRPAEPK